MELRCRNFCQYVQIWRIGFEKWTLSNQWLEYLSEILSDSNRAQKIGLSQSHSSTPTITLEGILRLRTICLLSETYKGLD
jgi:hypothetical protein